MITHEADSEVNAIGMKEINRCFWAIFMLFYIYCVNLFIANGPLEVLGCDCKNISMAQSSLAAQ